MARIYGLTLLASVALLRASAEDVWLFLKDGRVGRGESAGDPVSVAFPDGNRARLARGEVQGQRSEAQMEQAVAAMLSEMAAGRNIPEHSRRFQVFKQAAAAPLLRRVEGGSEALRLAALYALQYCWQAQALPPLLKAAEHPVADVRRVALAALGKNVPAAVLGPKLAPLAEHHDPGVARDAFPFAERLARSLPRMQRLLADSGSRESILGALPAYYAPSLTPATRAMLEQGTPAQQRAALVALIHQNALAPEDRAVVHQALSNKDARIREAAAEYLGWHGRAADLPLLQKAQEGEGDPYARASITGALESIRFREDFKARLPRQTQTGDLVPLPDPQTVRCYADFLPSLVSRPTREALERARSWFVSADACEPLFIRRGEEAPHAARFQARSALAQFLFAVPARVTGMLGDDDGHAEPPRATRFMAPVRGYVDPKRTSFGWHMDKAQEVFANSVHVGDDVGWEQDHLTVVCIAAGLVKHVAFTPTWGHLVVVEHQLADGARVCSLYGHLSPMLLVKPGDRVLDGQKLGSVGRSFTVENGGYLAHLHFGIHRGPFVQEQRWICGYVAPDAFSTGRHGWLDPQRFLKEHAAVER